MKSNKSGVPMIKRKLIQSLRQVLQYYCEERKAAIEKHKIKIYLTKKDGTKSKKYTVAWACAMCGDKFSKVQWDHIKPVGKEPGWPPKAEEWGKYIESMFCNRDNYQPLCEKCHTKKTNEEKK